MMRARDDRPMSEQLVDLHVYLVPPDLWQDQLHSASNEIISNAVSAGFVRILPETTVHCLRDEIPKQIGLDIIPNEYVFLKSVGRCLTRVKAKQEHQMKVKHFLPPHAYCPEIFLLEPTSAMKGVLSSDDESSRLSMDYRDSSQARVRHDDVTTTSQTRVRHGDVTTTSQTRVRHDDVTLQTITTRGYDQLDRDGGAYVRKGDQRFVGYGQNLNRDSAFGRDSEQIKDSHLRLYSSPDSVDVKHPAALSDLVTSEESSDNNGRSRRHSLTESESRLPRYKTTSHQRQSRREARRDSRRDSRRESNSIKPSTTPLHADVRQLDQSPAQSEACAGYPAKEYGRHGSVDGDKAATPSLVSSRAATSHDNEPRERSPDHVTQYNKSPLGGAHWPETNVPNDGLRDLVSSEVIGVLTTGDGKMSTSSLPDQDEASKRRFGEERSEQTLHGGHDGSHQRHDSPAKHGRIDADAYPPRVPSRRHGADDTNSRSAAQRNVAHTTGGGDSPLVRNRGRSRENGLGTNSDEEFAEELGGQKGASSALKLTSEEQLKQLNDQLTEARQERKNLEIRREELVKKAKYLQSKTQSRRNQARDVWKKRYFDEKKKTPPLEEKSNRLRLELEGLHRKIVGQMEGYNQKPNRPDLKVLKPSRENNLRINATKLNHEIEELQRRVDDAKMKLTGEVKLRNQAESELRALRTELTQRKINVTLTRSQKLSTMHDEAMFINQQSTRHDDPLSPRI